jgi:hypothetical protein
LDNPDFQLLYLHYVFEYTFGLIEGETEIPVSFALRGFAWNGGMYFGNTAKISSVEGYYEGNFVEQARISGIVGGELSAPLAPVPLPASLPLFLGSIGMLWSGTRMTRRRR